MSWSWAELCSWMRSACQLAVMATLHLPRPLRYCGSTVNHIRIHEYSLIPCSAHAPRAPADLRFASAESLCPQSAASCSRSSSVVEACGALSALRALLAELRCRGLQSSHGPQSGLGLSPQGPPFMRANCMCQAGLWIQMQAYACTLTASPGHACPALPGW